MNTTLKIRLKKTEPFFFNVECFRQIKNSALEQQQLDDRRKKIRRMEEKRRKVYEKTAAHFPGRRAKRHRECFALTHPTQVVSDRDPHGGTGRHLSALPIHPSSTSSLATSRRNPTKPGSQVWSTTVQTLSRSRICTPLMSAAKNCTFFLLSRKELSLFFFFVNLTQGVELFF